MRNAANQGRKQLSRFARPEDAINRGAARFRVRLSPDASAARHIGRSSSQRRDAVPLAAWLLGRLGAIVARRVQSLAASTSFSRPDERIPPRAPNARSAHDMPMVSNSPAPRAPGPGGGAVASSTPGGHFAISRRVNPHEDAARSGGTARECARRPRTIARRCRSTCAAVSIATRCGARRAAQR